MKKFHINKKGEVNPCRADDGNCPIGGSHFESEESAYANIAEKYSEIPEVKKDRSEENRKRNIGKIFNPSIRDLEFGNNSARNTDISEGGAQVLVLALARGESIDEVRNPKDLYEKSILVDQSTMNLSEINKLSAKLRNDDPNDRSKITETVNSAKESYAILKSKGLSDEEILKGFRWMGKENTKGSDSTVGDIGITRENGENVYISLKVSSKTLHNASMVKSLDEVDGKGDFRPFDDDEEVKKYDERSFEIASRSLRHMLHRDKSAEFSVDGQQWKIKELSDGKQYITYERKRDGQYFSIPAEALTNLSDFKKLKKNEQKVLSKFISSYSKEFENKEDYDRSNSLRMKAVSEAMKNRIGDSQDVRKRAAAKFLGLRNDSPYYVNSQKTSSSVGKIPSKESFLKNKNISVGDPIATESGLLIPVVNESNKKMSIVKVRTRYTDGNFIYGDLKSVGEYSTSPNDVRYFKSNPSFSKYEVSSINESIFVLD